MVALSVLVYREHTFNHAAMAKHVLLPKGHVLPQAPAKQVPGACRDVEEHEVAFSWLRACIMWPGNEVLGKLRARSNLQLAPGIQNVAQEWNSGRSKNTKWPT
eukprot:130962-Pyramimonas_sp.AAC.1